MNKDRLEGDETSQKKYSLHNMTGKTHQRIGLLAPMVFGSYLLLKQPESFNIINTLIFTGFSCVGSTFPDIDQTQSKTGKKMPITSHLIKFIHAIADKLSMKGISKATSHRGVTHSVLIWFILFVIAYSIGNAFNLIAPLFWGINGFFFGVATHLILDMLNKRGIPVLAPLSYLSFHFLKIRTGSVGEKLFSITLTLLLLGFMCFNIYTYATSQTEIVGSIFSFGENYFNSIKDMYKNLFVELMPK